MGRGEDEQRHKCVCGVRGVGGSEGGPWRNPRKLGFCDRAEMGGRRQGHNESWSLWLRRHRCRSLYVEREEGESNPDQNKMSGTPDVVETGRNLWEVGRGLSKPGPAVFLVPTE